MFSKLSFRSCVYDVSAWILLTTAFTYTVLRAYYLPITHDEAASSIYIASGPLSNIFLYKDFSYVNNHLLNSLLIKIFMHSFGLSEFVVRIPSLIGHVLYLIGIYKISKLFLKSNLMMCALVIFIFNPFLLELFSIARGYALGLGFSSIGIYYLLRYVNDQFPQKKLIHVFLGFMMFAFAVMANFSFFHIYMATFAWLVLYEMKNKRTRWELFIFLFPSFLFLISTCLYPCLKIYFSHEINVQHTDLLGKEGFWQNTVLSLIQGTLYNQTYFQPWAVHAIQFFIIGVVIIAVSLVTISLISKKAVLQHPTFALLRCVSVWLMLCCFMTILEGSMFKFGYATGRVVCYFIPMFYLLFLLAAQSLILIGEQFRFIGTGVYYLVVSAAFLSSIHFINCANFEDFYRANYCKSTRDVIKYLAQLHKTDHLKNNSVSIGTNWIFTPMLNFYILKDDVRWLKILPYREDLRDDYDYYYLCAKNSRFLTPEIIKGLMIVGHHYFGKHLKVIKVFPETGTYLAIPPG